ncbi:MAG: AAA family ATPase, partial [Streptosporangiaceae bacterium]
MATLHITRGLPASGKTTWATAWTAQDRAGRARVNRDDLRAMLDTGEHVRGVTEKRVMAVRDAAILDLLRQGFDVVCDDTN